MKLRSSTKIAVGAVLCAAGGYLAYNGWATYRLSNANYPDLAPSRVNLIALEPGLGYRIIVANGVAQLAEFTDSEFGAPSSSGGGATDTNRKRIPISDMLKSLQGDVKALSKFVMTINEIKESDLPPPPRKVWTAEQILAAIAGDQKLKGKLEEDINVRLDGTPLDQISTDALLNGIVIDSPVKVRVPVGSTVRELTARIQEGYKPRLMRDVEKVLEDKDFTKESLAGYYRIAASQVLSDPGKRENVGKSLFERVQESRLQTFADAPERILVKAKVIVNSDQIESASSKKYQSGGKSYSDLSISLNEEGQMRLWKYSRGHRGFQLLLTVDGIAIAAPKIIHELSQRDVNITQLPEDALVRNALEAMNGSKSGGT